MTEQDQKVSVHIDNYTGEKPIVIVTREDSPREYVKPIEYKAPEPINLIGTIDTPLEFLNKRYERINVLNTHIEVCREDASITLVVNESNFKPSFSSEDLEKSTLDSDRLLDLTLPKSSICGRISFSKEFTDLGINADKRWSPVKLAQYFRLNRHLFDDKQVNMALVSQLKNIKAVISGKYQKEKETHGTISQTEFFELHIAHELPDSFVLNMPIFKGGEKAKFAVEIDAEYIDGNILVSLVSPAMNEEMEVARDAVIDDVIKKITDVAPDIVVIYK